MVIKSQPSGINSFDFIYLATAIYKKRQITLIGDDCGLTFRFMACWSELKDDPKFDVLLNPPQTPEATENNEKNDDYKPSRDEVESFKRPVEKSLQTWTT